MVKLRITFVVFGILTLLGACSTTPSNEMKINDCELKGAEIQHMVIFNLLYEEGSAEARIFLEDGKRILSAIPVVKSFQAFQQVSIKNNFQYGFSMVFANQEDYTTYNNHPDHVAFVQERWMKEVSEFLEIDFKKP